MIVATFGAFPASHGSRTARSTIERSRNRGGGEQMQSARAVMVQPFLDRRFELLIENSSELITLLDEVGTFLYVSPAYERILGYAPEALQGLNVFGELMHPHDVSATVARFRGLLAAPLGTASAEFRYRHVDGRWLRFEAIGTNLLGDVDVGAVVVNTRRIDDASGGTGIGACCCGQPNDEEPTRPSPMHPSGRNHEADLRSSPSAAPPPPPPEWLLGVVERLQENLHRPVEVAKLAGEAGVHPGHLSRLFRRYLGSSVTRYVRHLRLEFAQRELTSTRRPLAEIALEAGFSDQSHFTRTFRAATGMTPGEFRRLRTPDHPHPSDRGQN